MKPVKDDELYALEVVEEDPYNSRVKVHYVGYGVEEDEWRDKADITVMKPSEGGLYLECSYCFLYM